jgi:hypothetical protein
MRIFGTPLDSMNIAEVGKEMGETMALICGVGLVAFLVLVVVVAVFFVTLLFATLFLLVFLVLALAHRIGGGACLDDFGKVLNVEHIAVQVDDSGFETDGASYWRGVGAKNARVLSDDVERSWEN